MPNYMNLTESTKAKQRAGSHAFHRIQRQSMDELQFRRSAAFYNEDSKSSAGSYQPPNGYPLVKSSVKPKERRNRLYD